MRPDPEHRPHDPALTASEQAFLEGLERQLQGVDVQQRAQERHPLRIEVDLSSMDQPRIPGRTLDLSRGGLRAVFRGRPELGLHYAVCLHGLRTEPVRTLGRCLRVALVDEERCEAVLHFEEPLPPGGVLG